HTRSTRDWSSDVCSSDLATLVVTDNDGLSSSATVTITATAPPNQPPVASAAASPTTGTAPLAVAFSSAGSSDPDGTIQSYSWARSEEHTSELQSRVDLVC